MNLIIKWWNTVYETVSVCERGITFNISIEVTEKVRSVYLISLEYENEGC